MCVSVYLGSFIDVEPMSKSHRTVRWSGWGYVSWVQILSLTLFLALGQLLEGFLFLFLDPEGEDKDDTTHTMLSICEGYIFKSVYST